MANKRYRVAIIGSTGRGGYGHGLDTAFRGLDRAELCAVADADSAGRQQTGQRLGVTELFADYRAMLDRARPDIVCIGPTWLTDRVTMVQAAAEHGCHIYCEKPLASDLSAVDAIQEVCSANKITVALAHQWRAMPPVQKALADIRSGKFGRVLRMRARPKDDARGGGEELLIHGTHWFDLMLVIAGPPVWVSGHIRVGHREATKADRREGSMPVGPICGDSILAVFGFGEGVIGTFDSTAGTAPSSRPDTSRTTPPPVWDNVYGLTVECERATLQWRQPGDVFVYPAPGVLPDLEQLQWNRYWIEDWHFTREHRPRPVHQEWLTHGNRTLAIDLMDAIEQHREPLSPLRHGRLILEMVQGAYASHFADGRRLPIPLAERGHPLS